MPYRPSRTDRAWELFVALVAASKSAAINRAGTDKSIGRIPGPFFFESLAREAYIAADAFEKVYRETAAEERPPAEGAASPSPSFQAIDQTAAIPPDTNTAQEMLEAFKQAGQSIAKGG